MFFIGIFGIEDKQKEIRKLENLSCRDCNTTSSMILVKRYSFFHIFFLPLFRWNEQYYVICRECNRVYEIPKEKGKQAENGNESEITYWDLKLVEYEGFGSYRTIENKCRNCGRTIEPQFKYCPYCGEKGE